MHYSLLPAPHVLHIPDGFLSVLVSAVLWVISLIFLTRALRQTRKSLGERDLPLMGVLAAAIFAGQMLNFSIPGGTSGHLMGSALAVILLGPWPAMVVISAVVVVQALLFQDGGLLALGANIFNMAIVGVFVSYAIFATLRGLLKKVRRGNLIAGFAAAWVSIVAAALAAALELAISGTSPANVAVPAMAAIHAVIGLGEGLITAGALTFILSARKDLFNPSGNGSIQSQKGLVIGGGLLAILLTILSPLASNYPDGLEAFAEQNGFLGMAREAAIKILPNYQLPGLASSTMSTIIAGLVGIVVVFALIFGILRAGKRRMAQDIMEARDE